MLFSKIKDFFIRKKNLFIAGIVTFIYIVLFPFIPYKFTYVTTAIFLTLWFLVFKTKVIINYEHENSVIKGKTSYYRGWLLNISFIYSMFFIFYLYLCSLARGIL